MQFSSYALNLDAGDLTLDIEPGPRPGTAVPTVEGLEEIWLTERTVGGGGIIENFITRYGEDPRRFFDLVESGLRPSDCEIVDEQLTLILNLMSDPDDTSVRDQITLLRQAYGESHNAYADAFDSLIRMLGQRGVFVCPRSGSRTCRAYSEARKHGWNGSDASGHRVRLAIP